MYRIVDIYHIGVFRTAKMERFAKIVVDNKPLTIFAKCSILYVWQGFLIMPL